MVSRGRGERTPILALPSFFLWGTPTFEFGSIFTLTVLGLLMIPNQIGSLKAMELATGEETGPRLYDRGLAVIGIQPATRELLDIRSSFAVGFGPLIGTGIMFVPAGMRTAVPYWLSSVLGNGVVVGMLTAILIEQIALRRRKGSPDAAG